MPVFDLGDGLRKVEPAGVLMGVILLIEVLQRWSTI